MSQAKAFGKLRRSDFEECPVWEWQLDETAAPTDDAAADESFVHPTSHRHVPTAGFAQWLVGSTIVLADGSEMPGIVEVTVNDGAVSCQPITVFLLERKLAIPARETNRLLARYAKAAWAHPVGWRLSVPIAGEASPRQGKLEGADLTDLTRTAMDVLLALKRLRR